MKYPAHAMATTRSTLLAKIRDPENAAAWERFFNTYAGYIYSIAYRAGLQPADADEATQATLLQVMKQLTAAPYDRSKGPFHTWLAICAKSRTRDNLRAIRARQKHETTMSAQSPGGESRESACSLARDFMAADAFVQLADEEWQALVHDHALKALRDKISAKAFTLFHAYCIEEWPLEKVMAATGASRASVYQTKHRVLPLYAAELKASAARLDAPSFPANL